MALSKLELNEERVEEIAQRMKDIIETTWLRDQNLNDAEVAEFRALRREIENMGMHVNYKTNLNLDDPSNPKVEADIIVWIPKNTTIQ